MNIPAVLRALGLATGLSLALSFSFAASEPAAAPPEKSPAAAKPAFKLPNNADEAWKVLSEAQRPPVPPAEWNDHQPSKEEQDKFKASMAKAASAGADLAREFTERFPDDSRTPVAKDLRDKLEKAAARLGNADGEGSGAAAGTSEPKPAGNPEDAAFIAKFRPLMERVRSIVGTNQQAALHEYYYGLKDLQKEFPTHPQVAMGLLECGESLPQAEGLPILQSLATNSAILPQVQARAAGAVKRAEMMGKPINIQYTAVDGREVDTAKLRGKVVLVDFWATWCGPCVAALPEVKSVYSRLHDKGLEIVGISLDDEKENLARFIARNEMPWTQFFDGKGWHNKFAEEYGIQSIPAMWLLDKKGMLREIEARDDLEGKVAKLLGEN